MNVGWEREKNMDIFSNAGSILLFGIDLAIPSFLVFDAFREIIDNKL